MTPSANRSRRKPRIDVNRAGPVALTMGFLAAAIWATSAAFAQEASSKRRYYVDGTKALEEIQMKPGQSEVTIYATPDAMCADQAGLPEMALTDNARAILEGKQPPQ